MATSFCSSTSRCFLLSVVTCFGFPAILLIVIFVFVVVFIFVVFIVRVGIFIPSQCSEWCDFVDFNVPEIRLNRE